nr:MAG TPA: hypothetical protein [Caudoviricetes sp.]
MFWVDKISTFILWLIFYLLYLQYKYILYK